MDFLKKFTEATKIDTKETPAVTSTGAADEQPPSQADLFASAQVVAQAARATIQKDPTNVDNYKLAGAAADILDAAEHYGKLDTATGVGSYVEKAEGYLKKYESSNSPPPKSPEETKPKSTTPAEAEASDETDKKVSHPPPAEATEETEKTVAPSPATEASEVVTEEKAVPPPVTETAPSSESPAAGDAKSEDKEEPAAESKAEGGGYGSVLKAAGDFWKKN